MRSGQIGRCRGCGRPVMWVVTEKGRRMPLDPRPSEQGNVVIDPEEDNVARVFRDFDAAEYWRVQHDARGPYTCHFDTCPKADEFRRAEPIEPIVEAAETPEVEQLALGGEQ